MNSKTRNILIGLAVFLIVGIIFYFGVLQTIYPSSITPTDDSYVSERSPSTTRGSYDTMSARTYSDGSQNIAYMKFKIPDEIFNDAKSGIIRLTGANLFFYSDQNDPDDDSKYFYLYESYDNWDENTITWDNKPGYYSSSLYQYHSEYQHNNKNFDVTPQILRNINENDHYISFFIRTSSSSSYYADIKTKESYNSPKMSFTWDVLKIQNCTENSISLINNVYYICINGENQKIIELVTLSEQQKQELLNKINELNATAQQKAAIIDELTANINEQSELINQLQATTAEKAAIIDALNLNIADQAALISQLQATNAEKAQMIEALNLNIAEQTQLIAQLQATTQEKAAIISSLQLTIQQQAQMINDLTDNLNEKAYYISQLQATNEEQAQLISAMQLSFAEQAGIITNLQNTIAEDAIIIANLNLSHADEGALISQLNLTIQEQVQIIQALNLRIEEEGTLISNLRLNISESAEIINSLNLRIEDEEKLINQLKLTNEQQKELVSKLNLKVEEQQKLLADLKNLTDQEKQIIAGQEQEIKEKQDIISDLTNKLKSYSFLYILSGVAILVLIITIIIMKIKPGKHGKRRKKK